MRNLELKDLFWSALKPYCITVPIISCLEETTHLPPKYLRNSINNGRGVVPKSSARTVMSCFGIQVHPMVSSTPHARRTGPRIKRGCPQWWEQSCSTVLIHTRANIRFLLMPVRFRSTWTCAGSQRVFILSRARPFYVTVLIIEDCFLYGLGVLHPTIHWSSFCGEAIVQWKRR